MTELGQLLEDLADGMSQSGLSVTAGNSGNSNSGDLGANTVRQALFVACQFAFSNTGSTDNGDYQVLVQESDDDTNWPDDGEGLPLASWRGGSAGADLTRSRIYTFRPALRYYRFHVINDNGSDTVSFSVETAHQIEQSE